MSSLTDQLTASREHVLRHATPEQLRACTIHIMDAVIALLPADEMPYIHYQRAHEHALGALLKLTEYNAEEAVIGEKNFVMTPRKILRRIHDHALDHLNQIEQWVQWQARGIAPMPADGWAGSAVTMPEDHMTIGREEIAAWLWRINLVAQWVVARASQLTDDQLDWQPPQADAWTLRTVIHHLAKAELFYALSFEYLLPDAPTERYTTAHAYLLAGLARAQARGYLFYWGMDERQHTLESIVQSVLDTEHAVG
jgi:DinB superfamily